LSTNYFLSSPHNPIFAAKLRNGMFTKGTQLLFATIFSIITCFTATTLFAQHHENEGGAAHKEDGYKLDMKKVIFGHIGNSHDFHIISTMKDGHEHPISIPLPVILYSKTKGFQMFMSSKFEHGHKEYNGYNLVDEGKTIVSTDANEKFYDFSLTRNVVQMLIAMVLLIWIMTSIAKRYRQGQGVKTAPKGMQSLLEPVIAFVRDEVAKPNLGYKANKYLPYLLTIFFFILINNIIGLIPGTANVTGNIAFTILMGMISFIVMIFSSNKHYWGHIINPPGVPGWVKIILVPVEILGFFLKPVSLIIRLFANMVAGHIIIICLISLIFIFGQINPALGYGSTILSIPFTIFIYFIEVLVAFLQAFIFTTLTAVLIGQAIEGDHSHDDHKEVAHAH
jgi:F-type H+-transporting ATPase subunit a